MAGAHDSGHRGKSYEIQSSSPTVRAQVIGELHDHGRSVLCPERGSGRRVRDDLIVGHVDGRQVGSFGVPSGVENEEPSSSDDDQDHEQESLAAGSLCFSQDTLLVEHRHLRL
jgi:hypothetical protein